MFASRRKILPLAFALSIALLSAMVASGALAASGPGASQLQNQAAQLKQKADQAQAGAQEQKDLADRAAATVQQVSGQIDQIGTQVQSTVQTIQDTQSQIGQQDAALTVLQAKLAAVTAQQDALIRDLYIAQVSYPQDMLLFSGKDIGDQARIQEHIASLDKAVSGLLKKTADDKRQVSDARDQLVRKNDELGSYRTQQVAQQQALADFRQTEGKLQQDAVATERQLEAQAASDRAQENKLEQQVEQLLTQAVSQKVKGIAPHGAGTGQRVRRGDIVGNEGSTGFSTGAHVHQEVRLNGSAVNPQPYIDSGTIRWALDSFVKTQGFGRTDFSSHYASDLHTGIDIAGPYGEPVHAPADGTVILNAVVNGYGHAWAEQLDNGLVVLLGHMI